MMTVSRETMMARYVELLVRWSGPLNLSSQRDSDRDGFQAHIQDSLCLIPYLAPDLDRILDLGSGQGFPAIPVAIMTGVAVDLIEADRRKAAFLTTVLASLGLAGSVTATRLEQTTIRRADCVTARALAPMKRLLPLATPFVAGGGCCLFLKGPSASLEVAEIASEDGLTIQIIPTAQSRTNLVKVTGFH